MLNNHSENSYQNRYEEIIEELAKLSDWELKSYCLSNSDNLIIQKVLDYKRSNLSTS